MTVTGNVPVAAVPEAVSVSRFPFVVPHVAVTPTGTVPIDSCTLPVNPFAAPTSMVDVAVPGRETDTAGADGVSVKVGITTVTVTTVDAVKDPDTPLIVIG